MRLISLRYHENCVWPTLKCHTSPPPHPWGVRLSPPRPSRVWGGDKWQFRLRVDIYVHQGIIKGGIQRKHIFFLWVVREGHNEQTLSFFTDDQKNYSVKIIFF